MLQTHQSKLKTSQKFASMILDTIKNCATPTSGSCTQNLTGVQTPTKTLNNSTTTARATNLKRSFQRIRQTKMDHGSSSSIHTKNIIELPSSLLKTITGMWASIRPQRSVRNGSAIDRKDGSAQ